MKGLLSDDEIENLLIGFLKASGGSAPEEEIERFFTKVDCCLFTAEMIRYAAHRDDIHVTLGDEEQGDFVFHGIRLKRSGE